MKNLTFKLFYLILFIFSSILNAQTFTNFTTNEGLPDDYVSGGIAIDSNNNKWVGTASGVAKFDDNSWTVYTTENGLSDNYITCITVDKNNNVWAGTDLGVNKFDGTTWTVYSEGLIDNSITAIAADIDGSVWIGTYSGITHLDGTNFTNYTSSEGLGSDMINGITIDKEGNKYICTQIGGLTIYDNKEFKTITKESLDSLLDNNIFAVAVDDSDNIWVGTWYGMTKLDKDFNWLANYRMKDGLFNDFLRDIKFDSEGNMFIGIYADYNNEGAITIVKHNNWQSFSVEQGLIDMQVIELAIDKNDNVWIATGAGVSKMDAITGLKKANVNNNLYFYPNPAMDKLFLNTNIDKGTVRISDLTGRIMINKIVRNSNYIDISSLPAGIYTLQFINDSRQLNTKLVVSDK